MTLAKGTPQELGHWADIIEKTANELCNDPECKRIHFKIDVNRNVSIDTTDYDALDCLLLSFKKHENEMPNITQKILQHALHVYRQKT